MKLNRPIGVRLQEPTERKLKQKAEKNGVAIASYIRMICTKDIENEK